MRDNSKSLKVIGTRLEFFAILPRLIRSFIQHPASKSETRSRLQSKQSTASKGFLTQNDFVELYESCGKVLHADNPYGEVTDLSAYERQAPIWSGKIKTFLNHHQIQLVDSEDQVWCIMHAEHDGRVHAYVMERVERPRDDPM